MKKGVFCVVTVFICLCILLSGCQDTSSVKTKQIPENVSLESTIVEFADVTFEKNTNESDGTQYVTVGWLFHNIAGRMISARIDVKFYDVNDILMYNNTKYINNIPADFTERMLQESNKVSYRGKSAALVDHVVISVSEITV
jgi:hypothetical protein